MKRITKWYKLTKNSDEEVASVSFNHYEDGWNQDSAFPSPFHPNYSNQVAWVKDDWTKIYAYMNENNQIVKLED